MCDLFWPSSWSLIFGSVVGIALALVWLRLIWILTHIEEDALIREYGDSYRANQARAPRLRSPFPGPGGSRPAGG